MTVERVERQLFGMLASRFAEEFPGSVPEDELGAPCPWGHAILISPDRNTVLLRLDEHVTLAPVVSYPADGALLGRVLRVLDGCTVEFLAPNGMAAMIVRACDTSAGIAIAMRKRAEVPAPPIPLRGGDR